TADSDPHADLDHRRGGGEGGSRRNRPGARGRRQTAGSHSVARHLKAVKIANVLSIALRSAALAAVMWTVSALDSVGPTHGAALADIPSTDAADYDVPSGH